MQEANPETTLLEEAQAILEITLGPAMDICSGSQFYSHQVKTTVMKVKLLSSIICAHVLYNSTE